MKNKLFFFIGILWMRLSFSLYADGQMEVASNIVDKGLNYAGDAIIDYALPDTDEGAREIAKSAIRATFNPFSNQGYDDMVTAVQDYFSYDNSSNARSDSSHVISRYVSYYADEDKRIYDVVFTQEGDKLQGAIQMNVYKIKTSFGIVPVPKEDLSLIMFGTDNVYLITKSGDKLAGELLITEVVLQTNFLGKLTMPANGIRFLLLKNQ